MIDLYSQEGISRQAHFQQLKRKHQRKQLREQLIEQVRLLRSDHPRMGLRKIYYKLRPEGVGRDQFERLMADAGFKLPLRKSYHRTTYPDYKSQLPNLITGMDVRRKDQVWVSDITYLRSRDRH